MSESNSPATVTREAAKRLALELDALNLKPLPQPGTVLVAKRGSQEQPVRLMRTDSGQWHWFWMWEPFRTEGTWEYEQGLPLGRERDMARRLPGVLEIAEAGEKVT